MIIQVPVEGDICFCQNFLEIEVENHDVGESMNGDRIAESLFLFI